jgi:hypothetical protein
MAIRVSNPRGDPQVTTWSWEQMMAVRISHFIGVLEYTPSFHFWSVAKFWAARPRRAKYTPKCINSTPHCRFGLTPTHHHGMLLANDDRDQGGVTTGRCEHYSCDTIKSACATKSHTCPPQDKISSHRYYDNKIGFFFHLLMRSSLLNEGSTCQLNALGTWKLLKAWKMYEMWPDQQPVTGSRQSLEIFFFFTMGLTFEILKPMYYPINSSTS